MTVWCQMGKNELIWHTFTINDIQRKSCNVHVNACHILYLHCNQEFVTCMLLYTCIWKTNFPTHYFPIKYKTVKTIILTFNYPCTLFCTFWPLSLLPQQTSKELKKKIIVHSFHSGCSTSHYTEKIVKEPI